MEMLIHTFHGRQTHVIMEILACHRNVNTIALSSLGSYHLLLFVM